MKFWSWLTGRWIIVRTGWPYPEGYGTWNERKSTLLDSGFTYADAKAACKELNS